MRLGLTNTISANGAGGLNADQLALDLQFAADKSLTARKGPTPTFTRASSGTFVGSDGLIQSAGNNVARFDHDPVTLASRGLLIEGSRTNLSLYSGALVAGTGWGFGATTSVVDGTGPDGNAAYNIAETTATSAHSVGNTGGATASAATSVTTGTVYTGSIFLKNVSGSIDWIQVTLGSGGFGTAQYANFNLSTGTVGNSAGLASGTSPRIENYGNGWYRCSISVAATTTTTSSVGTIIGFIQNTNGTTRLPSYAGSTSNQVLAALCQFEAGSFATSYIPTTTASVVRSADVCSISGAEFSGMFNASDGTLFSQSIVSDVSGTNRGVASIRGEATQFIRQYLNNSFFRNQARANDTETTLSSATGLVLTAFKMAVAYSGNNFAASINGASPSLVTRTLPTGLIEIFVGSLDSSSQLNGTLSAIRYYRKRLDNSKLASLTA